jgi:hypothetical protein
MPIWDDGWYFLRVSLTEISGNLGRQTWKIESFKFDCAKGGFIYNFLEAEQRESKQLLTIRANYRQRQTVYVVSDDQISES